MIDLVICAPTRWGNPGGFDDNVYGFCARCKRADPLPPARTGRDGEGLRAVLLRVVGTLGDVAVMTPEVREDLRRFARGRR